MNHEASKPTRVHEVLAETVARFGDRPALRVKRGGMWRSTTWAAYARDARRVARALIGLGVEPGKGVAILGYNCPEWLIADVGAIFAGAVPAGVYTTSTLKQVRYVAHHCEAKVAFADTPEQVEKFVAEQERLPHLEVVVQMLGPVESAPRGRLRVMAWEELLRAGDETSESALEARLAAQKPEDLAALIYTSGTTGVPKGVMLTHANIVWTAQAVLSTLRFDQNDVQVSYLPLSHVAEQMLTIHGPMAIGSVIYFADSIERLADTLKEVRPTVFMGVPRVWEKIQAKMMAVGASAPPLRRKVAAWARKVGLRAGYAAERGERKPLLFPLAKRLVFDKVRERIGLDRARVCATSAAPISRDTLEFFLSLGIPILEIYGMSECTGPATISIPTRFRTGTCGVALPGTQLKLGEDGEVLMRGPHVFKGYLHDSEATRAALDDDGWLHSGDIGTIDAQGYVQITDRKKELLITAGGENIAPQLIEGKLKSIDVVAQAVVIGDRRRYLSALLTLDTERLLGVAKSAGSAARTPKEAAVCPVFRAHVAREIDRINQELARVQTIKRFVILPKELSVEGGELTPTMKLKRKVIAETYKAEIESMYAEAEA